MVEKLNKNRTQINSNFNLNQDDDSMLRSVIKDICSAFDYSRYYNLAATRRLCRHIKEKLSEHYTLVIAKKITSLFNRNLPRKIFTAEITGEEIIFHIRQKLAKRIKIVLKNVSKKIKSPEAEQQQQQKIYSEDIPIPIARIIPGSNTKVIKCAITEHYHECEDINGKYVYFNPFPEVKVLGQIIDPYTVNATPDNLILPTMISKNTKAQNIKLIRDVDARKADIYVRKVLNNGYRIKALGNAPPTGTDVYLATSETMDEFFNIRAEVPIKFVKTFGHNSFIPVFDLARLIRRHIYAVGITDAGKGYYVNAFLSACVGRELEITPLIRRNVSVLYFDFTGQYANDTYGYFTALERHTGEDPRVIINGDQIGVQNGEDLIEIFFRKYRILDLGFASNKISGMKRYLAERIDVNSTFTDLCRELPCALRNVYSTNPTNHINRLNSHLEALTCRIWNEEIEPLKSPELFNCIDSSLRQGRFVIIDLSRIRDREYRPGVVYRILNFMHEHLNDNFARTQREMDYPVFVGIDEAHNFAPGTSSLTSGYYLAECNSLISRICAEDRKTGLSMVLITQRIAWMNRSVRANVGLWAVSKINSVDQDQLKKCVGNHDFVNFSYRTFHLYGDVCPIPYFPTRALNPDELAELKSRLM